MLKKLWGQANDIFDHRKVHIVVAFALGVICVDAYLSQSAREAFLTPDVWATVYALAALTTMWFVVTGTLRSLQTMTTVVAFAGLFRGLAFVWYDGRLTPLALNTIIVSYAYLAHRYERDRMQVV